MLGRGGRGQGHGRGQGPWMRKEPGRRQEPGGEWEGQEHERGHLNRGLGGAWAYKRSAAWEGTGAWEGQDP